MEKRRVQKKKQTNKQTTKWKSINDVEKQDEAILFPLLHKNILGQLREEGNLIRVSLKIIRLLRVVFSSQQLRE